MLEKKLWKKKLQNKNSHNQNLYQHWYVLHYFCLRQNRARDRESWKRLWHMIQNRQCRAFALDARNVAIWTKSGEKIYPGSPAVGHSFTTWGVSASSVLRNNSGLAPTINCRVLNTTRKSSVVYISFSLVVRCWIYWC